MLGLVGCRSFKRDLYSLNESKIRLVLYLIESFFPNICVKMIGVLQSKDPLESFCSDRKSSWPSSITSLLSHNLRLYRQKKCQVDPMKFIREVHCDLEMVYVGQMCLSWEFIQWQYEKALDLWESQPHTRLHHYNQVADDFQQFQVLLQRFLENEAFQGPRLQNYVKNRFVARNLLQVPVIRGNYAQNLIFFELQDTPESFLKLPFI